MNNTIRCTGGAEPRGGVVRKCRRSGRSVRAGVTLLEVLLATVILATSLAALGQMISNGVMAGVRCEQQAEAAVRCQSKLDELLAGVEPLTPVSAASFSDDPSWTWTLEVAPFQERLSCVTVAVQHESARQSSDFQLTRLIRNRRVKPEVAL